MTSNFILGAYDAVILKAGESDQETSTLAESTIPLSTQSTAQTIETTIPQTTDTPQATTPGAASTIFGSFILLISTMFVYFVM